MKKLLACLIVLSGLSFAQDSSSSPWGVYGGITSAGMSDSDGRTTGLSLGVSYVLNDKMSVGGGLSHRGGSFKDDEDGGTFDINGNAIELWSSYQLMQTDSFSLSTGLIYAHIYEIDVEMEGLSVSIDETDSDYGLYLNGTIPLQENLGLNVGYYMGLKELDLEAGKSNNLWIEVGYSF